MSVDRIYACQLARFEGWSKLSIPVTGEIEFTPDTTARVLCGKASAEASARHDLEDVVGGWCRQNRYSTSFQCEKPTTRGKITIYKNPSLGLRLLLWLKGL